MPPNCPIIRAPCPKTNEKCTMWVTLQVMAGDPPTPQAISGCVFVLNFETMLNIANNSIAIARNTSNKSKLVLPFTLGKNS